jgi:Ca-activated chloride channel family protein
LAAHATLPAAVDAADTLARMAGAKRIESTDAESRLALALKYQLLTDATNFIVVHERAQGEKAVDLPRLQQVAQMHAAGWGGVGSVRGDKVQCCCSFRPNVDNSSSSVPPPSAGLDHLDDSLRAKLSASRTAATPAFDNEEIPAFLRRPSPIDDPADSLAGLERAAKILDRQYLRLWLGTLPRSLADLRQLGIDQTTLDSLAALVAGDVTEETVVRAFLEGLEPVAKQAGASRQLLRALRNQFKTKEECAGIRRRVTAIVAGLSAAPVTAP